MTPIRLDDLPQEDQLALLGMFAAHVSDDMEEGDDDGLAPQGRKITAIITREVLDEFKKNFVVLLSQNESDRTITINIAEAGSVS